MARDFHQSWADKVRARRKSLGWSQAKLAKEARVDQALISRIESGATVPGDDTKWKLAGALGERMDALFSYPNVVPPFPQEAA